MTFTIGEISQTQNRHLRDLVKDADEKEVTRLGRLFAYKSGSGSVWVGDGCS